MYVNIYVCNDCIIWAVLLFGTREEKKTRTDECNFKVSCYIVMVVWNGHLRTRIIFNVDLKMPQYEFEFCSGLPDFSWHKIPKPENYTKFPRTIPNVHKI
jgi:hypothetical protein